MKAILVAAVSVDGRIAATKDQSSLDWTSKQDKAFFIEKTKQAGAVVMGRTTFETIGRPLKDRLIIVMTHKTDMGTLRSGGGVVEFSNKTPKEILADLEARGYKKAVIAGGASVWQEFFKENLIDDLFLTIEPILFGAGIPLVEGVPTKRLRFKEMMQLGPETIVLHYKMGKA